MFKDTLDAFVLEVKTVAGTKAFWFFLGLAVSGSSVPSIVATVRAFIGV